MVLRRLPILPDLAPDVAVHFGCFGGVREGATVNTPFLEHLSSSSLSPAQLAQATLRSVFFRVFARAGLGGGM